MDWKEIFKHSFILYGLVLIFGFAYFIFSEVIFINLRYTPLWPKTIIVVAIIPSIYSFFIRKTLKEWAAIAIFFILVSMIVFLSVQNPLNTSIKESKGGSPILAIEQTLGSNPSSALQTAICAPYANRIINSGPGEEVQDCFFHRIGFFADFILISLLSFIIIYSSLIAGNLLSKSKMFIGLLKDKKQDNRQH